MAIKKKSAGLDVIRVINAKEHNLKSVCIDIPKNTLTVITGPSGSGKSSLALDTVYAEGKRRYVESLSAYARQFLGVNKRPDVERIEGLCPAIAIDQKTVGFNPRSTVGTITEIYDYMRVFFARVGVPHCPKCGTEINEASAERITEMVLTHFKDQKVTIAGPIAIQKKGEFKHQIGELFNKGFFRFLIDGKAVRFKEFKEVEALNLNRQLKHTIFYLVDATEAIEANKSRLQEGIERTLAQTSGLCAVINEAGKQQLFSSLRVCLNCATSCSELEPRLFSFNSPIGACQRCHGLGVEYDWKGGTNALDEESLKSAFKEIPCGACNGSRLKPEALAVKIDGHNIHDLSSMSVEKLQKFLKTIQLNESQAQIAEGLLREITARLRFLENVGLLYLTMARTARTLSGGEGQRIRLATQIGSALSGVVYILDEPSIGLHQRDNDKLIATLKNLRDQGNTVLVVEHDMDTIREADYLIDMGPAAGKFGGEVTAHGYPADLAKDPKSLTGGYLSGRNAIKVPETRRTPTGKLTIRGATTNNLQNLTVEFPLGILLAVTGVSGSGKSSLVIQTLAPALAQFFYSGYFGTRGFEELEGLEQLANVVMVDQSPIGRTPRSNPATYLGIFDEIRALFASLPESNARGYLPGRFSFNMPTGRCFECSGEGLIRVTMHFLEDVCITCKACKGTRYNAQTLEIKFKNKNIAEILDMPVSEAVSFFESYPALHKRLQLLCDVGLDYLTLGQPSTTLSGGEAQRIKLVFELAKRGKNTLYILDEPTTGLHSVDIEKLLVVLNRLVDRGNSVMVIEHNLDLIKTVDYIIDVGPDGGDKGGLIVVEGTPEEVAECKKGFTGRYLKKTLELQ